MTKFSLESHLLACVAALVGCGEQASTLNGAYFDPKYIAAEADKGNLVPLTELNAACSEEVANNGRRLSVCNMQDEVRGLSKPISIGF